MTLSSRKSADEWQVFITSFKSSGLTQSEFCRKNNLNLSAFNKWLNKLAPQSKPEFISISQPNESHQDWVLDLTLGRWLHLVIRNK